MTGHQRYQTYDQITFLAEVQDLLRARGLTPDLPSDRYEQAVAGAQQLLAAMGIVPTIPSEIALTLGQGDWADHDETHEARG
ncbi:MAG TPA: hypothetical protein VFA46_21745 [Actinomycetes bacterium]|jgi:hypothetical protein|nr:hypothetical protein [Actinomycetes bacterium]